MKDMEIATKKLTMRKETGIWISDAIHVVFSNKHYK